MHGNPPPFAEDLLPGFDAESRHSVHVTAQPTVVYSAARRLDMSGSLMVRMLFRLRGMPAGALDAEGLRRLLFKPLREEPPRGFALGIIGRFWTPSGRLVDFDPGRFSQFDEPGYAKALWSFDVIPDPKGGARLRTVTRVQALDSESRRRFMRYWRVVGPFSGLIRTRLLSEVRDSAENVASGGQAPR